MAEFNPLVPLVRKYVEADAESAARSHSEVMHLAMNAGIPPEEVAQLVVDGIRSNQFYLFPHPELKGAAETRMQAMMDAFGEPDPERLKAQEQFMAELLK